MQEWGHTQRIPVPMLRIPVRLTDSVEVVAPIEIHSTDATLWSVDKEWKRLDMLAGLVLQTGSVLLVAAITVSLQIPHRTARHILDGTAVLAWLAVLLSFMGLCMRPAGLLEQVSSRPKRYRRKKWYIYVALVLFLLAIEAGPAATAMSLVHFYPETKRNMSTLTTTRSKRE